jgi:hypothetical protein
MEAGKPSVLSGAASVGTNKTKQQTHGTLHASSTSGVGNNNEIKQHSVMTHAYMHMLHT